MQQISISEYINASAIIAEYEKQNGNIIIDGNLTLNKDNSLVSMDGTDVFLTNTECSLLWLLVEQKNKVISKETINNIIWNGYKKGSNSIEVYINFLRKKIEKNFNKKLIHTVHGVGYFYKNN